MEEKMNLICSSKKTKPTDGNRKISFLEMKIKGKEEEILGLQNLILQMDSADVKKAEKIALFQEKCHLLENDKVLLKRRLAQAEGRAGSLKERTISLEKRLSEKASRIKEAHEKNVSLQEEVNCAREAIFLLEKRNHEMIDENVALTNDNIALKNELAFSVEKNAEFKTATTQVLNLLKTITRIKDESTRQNLLEDAKIILNHGLEVKIDNAFPDDADNNLGTDANADGDSKKPSA